MGVHFTVTVDHDFKDTSFETVRNCFEPLQSAFRSVAEIMEEVEISEEEKVTWEDLRRGSTCIYFTPAGFSLLIGPKALKMEHRTRFSVFIEGGKRCDVLRNFSRRLAQLFGQQKALYVPCEGTGDLICDWVSDGLSLSEMESRLRNRSTPPATIQDLAKRSWPELRYYIDEFSSAAGSVHPEPP